MNTNDVIPPTGFAAKALDQVEAVRATTQALRAEHAKAHPDRSLIGELNHDVGIALKLAETFAVLATAEEVRLLRGHVEELTAVTASVHPLDLRQYVSRIPRIGNFAKGVRS